MAKDYDVFGLRAIFGELASNDQATNKAALGALNMVTTTAMAPVAGGAASPSVFKRSR